MITGAETTGSLNFFLPHSSDYSTVLYWEDFFTNSNSGCTLDDFEKSGWDYIS